MSFGNMGFLFSSLNENQKLTSGPALRIMRKKIVSSVAVIALACGAFVLRGQAQIVTLSDGNTVAQIAPNSQAGMFNRTVGGVNQLSQQWFWYGIGNNAPASIDTISPAVLSGVTANTFTTTYTGGGFNVDITYTLTGGANGGPPGALMSDMGESIIINNTSASTLNLHFYEYSAFNLLGTPGGDNVELYKLRGLYNDAYQTRGNSASAETIVVPGANHGETAAPGQTLAKLNNGTAPVTLNDNANAGPGNVTWALQWDLSIAAGGSALIIEDNQIQVIPVPEAATPASLVLLSGVVALVLQRRRQRAEKSQFSSRNHLQLKSKAGL